MAITRENYASNDGLWDLVRKILNNLNGLIRGDFGILTRGTFEIAPSSSATGHTPSNGTRTVVTAGIPLPITNVTTLVNSVIITQSKTATGKFYVGSTATAPTPSVEVPITFVAPEGKKIDLNLIFVDASVSGEAVVYEAIT